MSGRQRFEAHDTGHTGQIHKAFEDGPTVCRVNDDGTCKPIAECRPTEDGAEWARTIASLLNALEARKDG